MPPKKSKGGKSKDLDVRGKSKDLGVRAKSANKAHKSKKKRKHRKTGYATFSYTILPKRKRLNNKVVTKLHAEIDKYAIARGVEAIKRLDNGGDVSNTKINAQHIAEQTWTAAKRQSTGYQMWKETRIIQIQNRALMRRKRAEARREEELKRKKYRFNPLDPFHTYLRGYKKKRHRITKMRFMKCVDAYLLGDVLNGNRDLMESPLWNEKLHLKNIPVEKFKQLKDHLHQFEVLVEGLKQGLFDVPGCDDFPLSIVRRKKKTESQTTKGNTRRKKKPRRTYSSSAAEKRKLLKKISFPPYEKSNEKVVDEEEKPDVNLKIIKNTLQNITNWVARSYKNVVVAPGLEKVQKSKENTIASTSTKVEEKNEVKVQHKPSLKSFPTSYIMRPVSLDNKTSNESFGEEFVSENSILTIPVPKGPKSQKKFIRALVEKKSIKNVMRNTTKFAALLETTKQEEEARQRHERVEKSDPLQILHPDERDSDIWTKTSTTTTDGYASWRRPRDIRNAGEKQEILAHKVDTTLGWRIVLLLIVIWEIGAFVKHKLDDIYYWIFTSHLYRENIWLFEPTLFPTGDKYFIIHLQDWLHAFISVISLSIIHRENECVSILFACSLLFDSILELAISTHDYVYLPEFVGWTSLFLTVCHVLWKVLLICLFIGYHYYSSGYIRKAREFKHRMTKLHNHEIRAKGTKGIQKRRMAWNWMTRHARNTNLRYLKKKYPNVKDGNFPNEDLSKEIKFSEDKELRLYTQKHSLNIGYPYNKLRDMKRYVFHRLEKSDYTDRDEVEEKMSVRNKKITKRARRSSKALTVGKWLDWKDMKDEERRGRLITTFKRMSRFVGTVNMLKSKLKPPVHEEVQVETSHPHHITTSHHPGQGRLTIDPTYIHRQLNKQIHESGMDID